MRSCASWGLSRGVDTLLFVAIPINRIVALHSVGSSPDFRCGTDGPHISTIAYLCGRASAGALSWRGGFRGGSFCQLVRYCNSARAISATATRPHKTQTQYVFPVCILRYVSRYAYGYRYGYVTLIVTLTLAHKKPLPLPDKVDCGAS